MKPMAHREVTGCREAFGDRAANAEAARSCRGIMLIECIAYIAGFFVVLSLAFMALHRTWKTHFLLERDAQDIATALEAGERWRADVRNASGPIESSGLPADGLIRISNRSGPVLYQLTEGKLYREVPGQSRSMLIANIRSAAMHPEERERVRAWCWELELKTRAPKARLRPLFTFYAVPNSSSP